MLDRIKNIFFSNKLTALALFTFAVAIGIATFIESYYSTNAARTVVYNAWWFELLHMILVVNLLGNIIKYKLYQRKKIVVFTFHVSFIVVILGAGVTRYFGFEGVMHIREGSTSNSIISDQTYLQFRVHNNKTQITIDEPLLLNRLSNKKFDHSIEFDGKNVGVSYVDYIPRAIDTVVSAENGSRFLELVTVGNQGRVSRYLEKGSSIALNHLAVGFNDSTFENSVKIVSTDSGLYFKSPFPVNYLIMANQERGVIPADTFVQFHQRRLYTINQVNIVFKTDHEKAKMIKVTTDGENKEAQDVLKVKVTCGNESKILDLAGGKGYISGKERFELNELNFDVSYGSKLFQTPFLVKCDDFRMERYPGSDSPSSFESDIQIIDDGNEFKKSYTVFMNNVVDYRKYRLFQSSYDKDEKGTVLSVNMDYWGTLITYIGYTFLFGAMFLTLFSKNTRFSYLVKQVRAVSKERSKLLGIILLFMFGVAPGSYAQKEDQAEEFFEIKKEHADKFARVLVMPKDARVRPMHTYADELIRKIYKKSNYKGLNSTQIFLGMMYNERYWIRQPIIYVDSKNKELLKLLKAKDNRLPFTAFFDGNGYVLQDAVAEAKRKLEKNRGTFDKEVIAVDERLSISIMIYQWKFLNIFPLESDPLKRWHTAEDYKLFPAKDTFFVKSIIPLYLSSVDESFKKNDWSRANTVLDYILTFQRSHGHETLPSDSKVEMEVVYNKLKPFLWLFIIYITLGPILFLLALLEILGVVKERNWPRKIFFWLIVLCCLLHVFGLVARWYIADHAPWSNSYEVMLFISAVAIVAGLAFSKMSKMVFAAAIMVAGVLLLVAHLDWLSPEITQLVPVLKSYWLKIHVVIITSSYIFLTIGSLLGLIVMLLMVLKGRKKSAHINLSIKELTYMNEITLTIGVFMAAIGTFLGGIWANESWGRYWGWDPKETWALVIVLYYAMVLHLRMIPKLNNEYIFSLFSTLGFGTVLMTFLGVNYYLAGLHSYAGGGTPPFPTFVIYLIGAVVIISVLAGLKFYRKRQDSILKG